MPDDTLLDYVHATAAMLALPLDDACARRVALHLGRTASMARQLDTLAMAPDDELAEIFCPAPFPERTDAGAQP